MAIGTIQAAQQQGLSAWLRGEALKMVGEGAHNDGGRVTESADPPLIAPAEQRSKLEAMRIVAISDTHTFENQITVPDGDVLVHAGDFTIGGTYEEVKQFSLWLAKQPHKHKIVVAGNHDWLFQKDPHLARSLVHGIGGAFYLEDGKVEINGVTFYGSPWQPRFMDWAFNLDRGEQIRHKWDLIPHCDVLITHGPPWGIFDYVQIGREHLGCEELIKAVGRVRPQAHIFGHIHGGYGQTTVQDIRFINASICNEAYRTTNEPIVVELEARSVTAAA